MPGYPQGIPKGSISEGTTINSKARTSLPGPCVNSLSRFHFIRIIRFVET